MRTYTSYYLVFKLPELSSGYFCGTIELTHAAHNPGDRLDRLSKTVGRFYEKDHAGVTPTCYVEGWMPLDTMAVLLEAIAAHVKEPVTCLQSSVLPK